MSWMSHRIQRLSVAALLLVASTGCGTSIEADQGSDDGLAEFASAAGYPNWAATNDYLVGYAGYDLDDPKTQPRYGALSIDDRKLIELPTPPTDDTTVPLGIGGSAREAILIAAECVDPPSSKQPQCRPGQLAIYSIAPEADSQWTRRTLPTDLEDFKIRSVVDVQPTDQAIGVVALGSDGAQHVITVGNKAVRDEGLQAPSGRESCISQASLYTLTVGTSDDPVAPVPVSLTRHQRTGDHTEIPLPPVSTSYGAIAVRLGCTDTSVYLTSSTSPAVPEPVLWSRSNDDAWRQQTDAVPPRASRGTRTLSGTNSLGIAWSTLDDGPSISTITSSGAGRVHDDQTGGVIQWRGSTGTILVLAGEGDEENTPARLTEVTP